MNLSKLFYGMVALSLIMTSGCATRHDVTFGILQSQPHPVRKTITFDELIQSVHAKNSQVERFKADLKLTFTDTIRSKGKTVHCDGKIALEKPDKLRLYGSQPLSGKIFDIISNSERFYIYSPKEGRVLTGSSKQPLDSLEPATKIRPNDVMHAFLLYDIKEMCERYVCFFVHEDASYVLYFLEETNGTYSLAKRVWVDDDMFEITRHQTFDHSGELDLDVKITDFFIFPEYGYFPKRMEIESPYRQLQLIMEFSKIELNPALNHNVFTFTISENIQVIEMDR
ncbi:MAG: DUF4292 domain-containing protein [Candidatus Auribacterota bacterium]|jgi:outer membrane lipoprotein-sorting protein|nr:DUF4292 domain-containing protein [Candidatus Auribacterota bacterium]